MNGDADPFSIEILVSHFSVGTKEFFLPKYDELIAFEPACSSENFMYTLWALAWANSICLIIFVWPLIGLVCLC